MKKILVVLLVLAVAGGVFAQEGEWTIGGYTEIGTRLDFQPDTPTIQGNPYNSWEQVRGTLSVGYNKGGLSASVDFKGSVIGPNADIFGAMNYSGENYGFKAASSMRNLLGAATVIDQYDDGTATLSTDDDGNVIRDIWTGSLRANDNLFGYYNALNGIVHMEANYHSGWNNWWVSDQTAGFIGPYGGYGIANVLNSPFDDHYTWGLVDGHNFFLTNLVFSGFQFGIKVPFVYSADQHELIDDVLMKSVVGFKFEMAPVEIAAQFLLEDYGVYFGGKVGFGPVDVGLSFMGILNTKDIKVGASASYGAELFGAGLKGWFGLDSNKNSQIGVEPYFYYNVLPTHFQFKTDIGFYFNSLNGQDLEVEWALRPQLFWNFLGTGAGDFGAINTGMIFRYEMQSESKKNTLDVVFKWGM